MMKEKLRQKMKLRQGREIQQAHHYGFQQSLPAVWSGATSFEETTNSNNFRKLGVIYLMNEM